MKIIISPAKQMKTDTDSLPSGDLPVLLPKTEQLLQTLKGYSFGELKKLFRANDKITGENLERYAKMDVKQAGTPALLSYVGLQYQYMAPQVFTDAQWKYACGHLRILSGFYGILRPDDKVTPYRLEMQAALSVNGAKDLYAFWGRHLYEELRKEESESEKAEQELPGKMKLAEKKPQILNLASKEYSKCIEDYLEPGDQFVTCIFGEMQNGTVKVKGTLAKMARGEMVRWLSMEQVEDLSQVKAFRGLDYAFVPELSTEKEYVFLPRKEKGRQK